jgi:hypothetical protein
VIIYSENRNGVIVRKKSKKELEKWEVDMRQRLNVHKRIEVYGFNFNYKNFSDETLLMLFEKSKKEMFDRMFIKKY